jgi:hypothetical protein
MSDNGKLNGQVRAIIVSDEARKEARVELEAQVSFLADKLFLFCYGLQFEGWR